MILTYRFANAKTGLFFCLDIKFAKNKVLRSRELFGKFLKKTLHLEEESYEIAKLLGGSGHSFSINYHKIF
jgi:hypothetical protein